MESLFTQLYPFVFAIGLAGYGPQLYRLMRNPASADALSLSTWVIWAATWFISLGYGITKLHDVMFCLTAGMNLAAHIVIVAFILYRQMMVYREQNMNELRPVPVNIRR